MENQTVYIRKIGNKSWQKYYSFPVTIEEAKTIESRMLERGGYEVKISEATKGKTNNY